MIHQVTITENNGVYFNHYATELMDLKEHDRLWFDYHGKHVIVFKSKYGANTYFYNKSKKAVRVRETIIRKNIQAFYGLRQKTKLKLERWKDVFVIKPF